MNLHSAKQTAPFVLNVISLLLIAIWLSLRAHRTVLDYFSRNDVLLPLVSACGKQVFYKALWLITAVRVFFFLFAIFPFLYLSASWIQEKRIIEQLFRSPVEMDLWIIALLASLGATTIISSLAELKHHHSFTAVLYKYVPFGCCLLGVLVWGWSIVIGGSSILSDLVLSLPVFGLIPIAVSPVLKLDLPVVFLHATLSIALMVMLLRINAKWFASHLEEV